MNDLDLDDTINPLLIAARDLAGKSTGTRSGPEAQHYAAGARELVQAAAMLLRDQRQRGLSLEED